MAAPVPPRRPIATSGGKRCRAALEPRLPLPTAVAPLRGALVDNVAASGCNHSPTFVNLLPSHMNAPAADAAAVAAAVADSEARRSFPPTTLPPINLTP